MFFDSGECKLRFIHPQYNVSIAETPASDSDVPSTPPTPTTAVLVTATCIEDADTSIADSDDVRYLILFGGVGLFSIDEMTGQFSVVDQPFDYEEQTWYLVYLLCYLDSNPSENGTSAVNVTILPVNEYLPKFIRSSSGSNSITIPETTLVGTRIAATDPSIGPLLAYTARDRDKGSDGTIIYTLSGDGERFFDLDIHTGSLILNHSLDVDKSSLSFERLGINITACNENITLSVCNFIEFTVFVTSANDNAPQLQPAPEYNTSLPESAPIGSQVVQIVCVDEDNGIGGAVSMSFHKETSELVLATFELDSGGAVHLQEALDYEEGVVSYQFEVLCSDGYTEAVAQVRVDVLPVNDNPPYFTTELYEFSVERSSPAGHTVGQVLAEDNDIGAGSNLTYSIEENTRFIIDSLTGEIAIKDDIPSSGGSLFEIYVFANDGEYLTNTTVQISVKGPLSLPEFAGIISGVCAFIFLVVLTILVLGSCCCCYIRATRTRCCPILYIYTL